MRLCVYGGGLFSVTAFVWFLPQWPGEPHICYVVALIACTRSTFGNSCILSSFFSFILTSNKVSSKCLYAFMRLCVYGGGLFIIDL
jgi:hypothetical protein